MIQEIFPHVFHKEFTPRQVKSEDYLFVFRADTVLLRVEENKIHLPTVEALGIDPAECRSLFRQDDRWYTMLIDRDMEPPRGYAYYNKHQYREFGPMEVLFPCAVAGSLNRWYRANRFCGACGCKLMDRREELGRICPECGLKVRPKIMPAVIAAIRNGDKLLLTRYHGPASKRAALVAGYNEIGESIEDTLRREVMEEVGLQVKNLQFYKTQPWVITDSLMIGFFCDLDGDDTITRQKSELSAASWVARQDLPEDTAHLSLTAEMIDVFRQGLV